MCYVLVSNLIIEAYCHACIVMFNKIPMGIGGIRVVCEFDSSITTWNMKYYKIVYFQSIL